MSGGEALELRNLSKRFGTSVAVTDVNVSVSPGELVSFLGPSGSGKTTTLNMIAGFEHPDTGEVMIGGVKQGERPPYKRNIGMVFQNYALFPHLTVKRNVAFSLEVRGIPSAEIRQRVARTLGTVQLADKADRLPKQLSGGQQQRVALARALVYEPGIVLMDEPLGALDKRLRIELQLEIKRIQAELGVTIIYVTHDQDEALTMSDRICLFQAGRIIEIGPPNQLYETPRTTFAADFLGTSNLIVGRLMQGPGQTTFVRTDTGVELPVAFTDQPAGKPATFSIRPERIILDPDKAAVERIFDACIEGAIYSGSMIRLSARIADKVQLRIDVPNLGTGLIPMSGTIRIGWPATSAHLILE